MNTLVDGSHASLTFVNEYKSEYLWHHDMKPSMLSFQEYVLDIFRHPSGVATAGMHILRLSTDYTTHFLKWFRYIFPELFGNVYIDNAESFYNV